MAQPRTRRVHVPDGSFAPISRRRLQTFLGLPPPFWSDGDGAGY